MDIVEAKIVQVKDPETGELSKPVGLHPDIADYRIAKGEAVAYRELTTPKKKQTNKESK